MMRKQIRHALVWGPWQAHAVWFAFAFIGWCIAMYLSASGVSALIGLAVGGVVGILVLKHVMDWE